MEHADLTDRPTDEHGTPRELRKWLRSKSMTLAQWLAECRRKHDPDATALALQRRRLKLKR